jgi:hypothetical protein
MHQKTSPTNRNIRRFGTYCPVHVQLLDQEPFETLRTVDQVDGITIKAEATKLDWILKSSSPVKEWLVHTSSVDNGGLRS